MQARPDVLGLVMQQEQPEPTPRLLAARIAWNAMGGLEWSALDTIVDYLQVEDVDSLITDLIYIRDNRNA